MSNDLKKVCVLPNCLHIENFRACLGSLKKRLGTTCKIFIMSDRFVEIKALLWRNQSNLLAPITSKFVLIHFLEIFDTQNACFNILLGY